ncbi:hypothetical protein AAC387_Pa10g1572 [Persea americana]
MSESKSSFRFITIATSSRGSNNPIHVRLWKTSIAPQTERANQISSFQRKTVRTEQSEICDNPAAERCVQCSSNLRELQEGNEKERDPRWFLSVSAIEFRD